MFVACGILCLADVSSVSPSSDQTHIFSVVAHAEKHFFFKTNLRKFLVSLVSNDHMSYRDDFILSLLLKYNLKS